MPIKQCYIIVDIITHYVVSVDNVWYATQSKCGIVFIDTEDISKYNICFRRTIPIKILSPLFL